MPSSIRIRKFGWQDLEQFTHLFNEVNGIAGTEKANDAEFIRQFLSQPSCNPEENCYLAESQGAPVAFVLLAPELPIGRVVFSGGVLESHRGRGIGRRLLKTALGRAMELEGSVLHIAVPWESATARHLLETEDFHPVKCYWQMRWERNEFRPVELPQGFSLRSFVLGQDEEALTRLQNDAFVETWGFCPNTVEEVSARVRFKICDPRGIILLLDEGRFVAYNWTFRSSNALGSIGLIAMTGVHPDYRSMGLGRAVVAAGMEYLKAKEVDGIELEVDSENAPARTMYLSLGFRKIGQTQWYEKRLA